MIVTGKRRALHLLWLGCILGVVLIAAMVVPLSGPVRLHDPNLNQLIAQLQPGQPNKVRWNAMTILNELSERAAPAVPTLERAARNGDEYVRDSAQQVLETLGAQTAARWR